MGWTFSYNTSHKRADVVAEMRRGFSAGVILLADRVVGNSYWAALEKNGERFIFLARMQGGGKNYGWGYKCMDETVHPYHYDCPLSLLEICGETTSQSAAEWREKVREYHANRKAIAKPVAGLVLPYGTTEYQLLAPAGQRRGWYVALVGGSGMKYRMNARQVSEGLRNLAKKAG